MPPIHTQPRSATTYCHHTPLSSVRNCMEQLPAPDPPGRRWAAAVAAGSGTSTAASSPGSARRQRRPAAQRETGRRHRPASPAGSRRPPASPRHPSSVCSGERDAGLERCCWGERSRLPPLHWRWADLCSSDERGAAANPRARSCRVTDRVARDWLPRDKKGWKCNIARTPLPDPGVGGVVCWFCAQPGVAGVLVRWGNGPCAAGWQAPQTPIDLLWCLFRAVCIL